MRVLPLLVLICTGCASLQRPEVEPMPATLAEVNRSLEGRTALVYFADGRDPARGFVSVGPVETVILYRRHNGRTAAIERRDETVPTAGIERIDADASLSRGQGAARGAMVGGAFPLFVALVGGLQYATEEDAGALLLVLGLIQLPVSAGIGAGTGAVVTSTRDWVPVYEAPITRYPDAALALLEGEAVPAASR